MFKVLRYGQTPRFLHQNLAQTTRDALQKHGITELFPIQQRTFDLIHSGRDILARAGTR